MTTHFAYVELFITQSVFSISLDFEIARLKSVKTATLKKMENWFSLNDGQKYCRMLQREHSAILMTFIELPFVIQTFVLSIFEWPFYTSLTVQVMRKYTNMVTYNFQSKKREHTNPGRKKRRKKKI